MTRRFHLDHVLRLCMVAVGLLTPAAGAHGARAQEDSPTAIIAAPVDGQQLFGPVNIIGTAAARSAFGSYTLEYDLLSEIQEQWFLVQARVTQQVYDDVLGTWNTNMVPDGIYQLRLRVTLDDGTISEYIVSNLRVANSQPTPVPAAGQAQGEPVQPAATPGPTPTSPVVQPPSSNPQAIEAALDAPPAATQPDAEPPRLLQDESGDARVNVGRVQGAFCTGVYLAAAAFGLIAIYGIARRLGRRPSTYRDAGPYD